MKALAEVDFEFTEDDFDEALWKFVKVCHDFELQLGPAGWSGFTASPLTCRRISRDDEKDIWT